MPPQQGLGSNREATPTGSGQAAAQSSEDQSVAGPLGRALGLAAQDADFLAQGQQLNVLCDAITDPEQGEVGEETDEGL